MEIALLIQASYISVAASILVIRSVPPLRDRLLAYGSRASISEQRAPQTASKKSPQPTNLPKRGILVEATDQLASVQVPHSWFATFYAVSVISSIFWAHQMLFKGFAYDFLVSRTLFRERSMQMQQIIVIWTMMLVQGVRRLDECLTSSKPSASKMFIGHWAIGIWFYLTTGIAVWIEGIEALKQENFQSHHLRFTAPGLRTFLATILFMLASGIQRDCHVYLASLKTYTVPAHPAFNQVVCPHYLAECIIYLSLAIGAAPEGQLMNRTILCALVFVVVNLGVTADGTSKWYAARFGPKSVEGKWRMIPFVF